MSVALVLTLLAISGVALGVSLGQARIFSDHIAAVGGGLLVAISLFWLTPEIVSESGWLAAFAMTAIACFAIAIGDRRARPCRYSLTAANHRAGTRRDCNA